MIHVDLGPEAFAAHRADVVRAADTLRELIHEWLPGARTRTVLSPGLPVTGEARPATDLHRRLAALPDVPVIHVDLRARRVTAGGNTLDLTAREFDLLETFMRHPDQVLSREQLLLHVWSDGVDPASNVVDVFVRTLRGKIGPDRIRTVRGLGYRLEVRS